MSHAAIATSTAGERRNLSEATAVSRQNQHATKGTTMTEVTPLDRIAIAIDGAESSHGKDIGMWRPDPSGPQGPMQISEAAATDVGGGDRLDPTQNRAIGRAYLAKLHARYGNWPDAIAAYNWGLGKMDAWVKAGRSSDRLLVGVTAYLRRVLYESGLCGSTTPKRLQRLRKTEDPDTRQATPEASADSTCAPLYGGPKDRYTVSAVLEQPRSLFGREAASARSSWLAAMRDSFGCTIQSPRSLQCR